MSGVVETLSAALVHFLWQGCLVAALLAAALRVTRGRSAELRYALAAGALALMALAPPATVGYSLVAGAPARALAGPAPADPSPSPQTVNRPATNLATERSWPPPPIPPRRSVRAAIVAVWLGGVLVLTVLNTGGWLVVRRLRRSGEPLADERWPRKLEKLRKHLGIARAVAVRVSSRVDVPTVVGSLRPVVLLPTSALLGMSPQALEALLFHELAHVRRHDALVNLVQAAVETLLFYHPAVWWVSQRMRQEREHCCDDLAVGFCGNRQDYIQALVDMERLRVAAPRMAVAADGGSLVERIRRLTGCRSHSRAGGTRWTLGIGVLVIAFFATTFQVASAPAGLAAGTAQNPEVVTLAPAFANGSSEIIEGHWRARLRGGGVQLEMRLDGYRHNRNSMWLDRTELTGTGEDGVPGFLLQRDAGTFYFAGRLDGSDEESRFEFRTNPSYVDRMNAIGFDVSDSPRRLYTLAALDVSLAFAEGIRDAGYGDISVEKLTEFRIHGVTADFVSEMADAGYGKLSPDRLVEFRIHGVSPEFVRGMADSGLRDLSPDRLVEFRIHGVSPEFVREMADSGLRDLSPDRLVEFRIHGVSPEFVTAMVDVGFDDLPPNRLVEFRIHGVTPEFVREMVDLGLDDLSPSRLVEFRIHGVSPDFVRTARAEYGEDLSPSDLVDLRIHGGRHRR